MRQKSQLIRYINPSRPLTDASTPGYIYARARALTREQLSSRYYTIEGERTANVFLFFFFYFYFAAAAADGTCATWNVRPYRKGKCITCDRTREYERICPFTISSSLLSSHTLRVYNSIRVSVCMCGFIFVCGRLGKLSRQCVYNIRSVIYLYFLRRFSSYLDIQ